MYGSRQDGSTRRSPPFREARIAEPCIRLRLPASSCENRRLARSAVAAGRRNVFLLGLTSPDRHLGEAMACGRARQPGATGERHRVRPLTATQALVRGMPLLRRLYGRPAFQVTIEGSVALDRTTTGFARNGQDYDRRRR